MPRRKQDKPASLKVALSGDAVRTVERLKMLLPLGDEEPSAADVVRFALERCLDGICTGFPTPPQSEAGQDAMLRKLAQLHGEIAGYKLGDRQGIALAAQIAFLEERYALAEMLGG